VISHSSSLEHTNAPPVFWEASRNTDFWFVGPSPLKVMVNWAKFGPFSAVDCVPGCEGLLWNPSHRRSNCGPTILTWSYLCKATDSQTLEHCGVPSLCDRCICACARVHLCTHECLFRHIKEVYTSIMVVYILLTQPLNF
jgi:hypothetical protein